MKQYKGCYIDKVIFHNKEEIDRFLEKQALDAYKMALNLFFETRSLSSSILMDEKAERLVNQFGYTWEQVEEIETEFYKSVA